MKIPIGMVPLALLSLASSFSSAETFSLNSTATYQSSKNYSISFDASNVSGPVTAKRYQLVQQFTSLTGVTSTRTYSYSSNWASFSNVEAGRYRYTSLTTCYQFNYVATWTNCSSSGKNLTIDVRQSASEVLEAEINSGHQGVVFSATEDQGGGLQAEGLDAGDYIQWNVHVPTAGYYALNARGSADKNARINFYVNGALKANVGYKAKSNLKSWSTLKSVPVHFSAGFHTVRVKFLGDGQTLNWIKLTSEAQPSGAMFDSAQWRLVDSGTRETLSGESSLSLTNYGGTDQQHWRVHSQANGKFKFENESSHLCLRASGSSISAGSCISGANEWDVQMIRAKNDDHPALYIVRNGTNCLSRSNATGVALSSCTDSTLWYIESAGMGERFNQPAYDFYSLLLVKPNFAVPGHASAYMDQSRISAVQYAHNTSLVSWVSRMTDGLVEWHGTSVVSYSPVVSLECGSGACLPTPSSLASDIVAHVPRGAYDSVQVFFNPGSLNGGWGWGPGSSRESNYALWTTVNGHSGGPSASDWLTSNYYGAPEIFIHEPMHGLDGHLNELGVAIPSGWLHGAEQNKYVENPVNPSWLHWYRDYWLGKVIDSDDSYKGYGPRAFSKITPRAYANSSASVQRRIVQETSGKCLAAAGNTLSPDYNTHLVLSSNCSDDSSSFRLLPSGALKHTTSGMCIHPQNGTANDNTRLVLFPSCTPEDRILFTVTSGGSLSNNVTGACVHPEGGSANPAEGTVVLFHHGCDEQRLKFNLVP